MQQTLPIVHASKLKKTHYINSAWLRSCVDVTGRENVLRYHIPDTHLLYGEQQAASRAEKNTVTQSEMRFFLKTWGSQQERKESKNTIKNPLMCSYLHLSCMGHCKQLLFGLSMTYLHGALWVSYVCSIWSSVP